MADTQPTVEISEIGVHGDGVAIIDGKRIYVPFSTTGDHVDYASPHKITSLAPERLTPVCTHFGTCGGCKLQHVPTHTYLRWKESLLHQAFSESGLVADVADIVPCPPASRRRAAFTARRTKKTVQLGFLQASTEELINLDQCPVLVPEIETRLDALKQLVGPFLSRKGTAKLIVTATERGLSCHLTGGRTDLDPIKVQQVAFTARDNEIIQLAQGDEVLFTHEQPLIKVGPADVVLPPTAFLQATRPAQELMSERIEAACRHLPKSSAVCDLFSGVGTFTFPLASRFAVHAVEADQPSCDALQAAAERTQGIKQVTVERRNLFKNPLRADELQQFAAVVFDPPRAGAKEQAREIAASSVGTVIAVSCDPGTLAKDLSVLVSAGFQIEAVQPIDQFAYTPHLETVVVLKRS